MRCFQIIAIRRLPFLCPALDKEPSLIHTRGKVWKHSIETAGSIRIFMAIIFHGRRLIF